MTFLTGEYWNENITLSLYGGARGGGRVHRRTAMGAPRWVALGRGCKMRPRAGR
jgi:hypothetical protein